jgi:hypothetical protein
LQPKSRDTESHFIKWPFIKVSLSTVFAGILACLTVSFSRAPARAMFNRIQKKLIPEEGPGWEPREVPEALLNGEVPRGATLFAVHSWKVRSGDGAGLHEETTPCFMLEVLLEFKIKRQTATLKKCIHSFSSAETAEFQHCWTRRPKS